MIKAFAEQVKPNREITICCINQIAYECCLAPAKRELINPKTSNNRQTLLVLISLAWELNTVTSIWTLGPILWLLEH